MHIPDGFIGAGTSLGAGIVSAGGLSVAVRKVRDQLDDRRVPLAGLVAAFIFAVQMLNFPIAAGTSGHLLGGALAAVLMGPWAGMLCIAVVLVVQALFADGGLTALGLNILNMGVVTALGGFLAFRGLRLMLPASRSGVVAASGIAAGVSVVLSSAAFFLEFAIGGNADVSLGAVGAAMVGIHALIGVGEGLITAATVGLVLSVRPDLVYGAHDVAVPLEIKVGIAGAKSP